MVATRRPCYASLVRVLAFDLGIRRTGVAISDASGTLARPLEVVQGMSLKAQWTALLDVIARAQVEERAVQRRSPPLSRLAIPAFPPFLQPLDDASTHGAGVSSLA